MPEGVVKGSWTPSPKAKVEGGKEAPCYVLIGLWTASFPSTLSSLIAIRFPLSYADTSDCLVPIPYLPITPIFDRPLRYLVALCLSPYQSSGCYHVRYIGPQSGGTVGLGLCPLRSLTLTRSGSSCSI